MCTRCLVILGVLCSLLISSASAEIPQVISYQGKVTDSGGTPIADGDYTMTFTIYDAASGGSSLWSSGALTVTVSGGVFSVLLGDTGQPALNVAFDADYWVETSIEGDLQSPRTRLGSVGYAYMSSGLVAGTEVVGSVSSGSLAAISGTNSSAVNSGRGLYGSSSGNTGRGVEGWATSSTGYTFGGRFESQSTDGRGVLGHASASTGITYGVRGTCNSTVGTAVCGIALATEGMTYGVFGQTNSADGYAGYFAGDARVTGDMTVNGSLSAPGLGDITAVNAGTGLTGGGTSGAVTLNVAVPLSLSATVNDGVIEGMNASTGSAATGLVGIATAGSGLTVGVYGASASTDGLGVFGGASASTGVTWGVHGRSLSPSGYGVYYSGGLAGTGTKSCVVKTSQGPTLMYCQESPENWFEDFGEGQLANGRCRIELDPVFLETVTVDAVNPMHVFVQPYDEECLDLLVRRDVTGFEVTNPRRPTANGAFSYRVVAKRKGFEGRRLDYCKAAERDSYLYPELREKDRLELEAGRHGWAAAVPR